MVSPSSYPTIEQIVDVLARPNQPASQRRVEHYLVAGNHNLFIYGSNRVAPYLARKTIRHFLNRTEDQAAAMELLGLE